jgi:RHS repeat-associated protein
LPGQYFDKETNTHYNYFRDYDPSIGRYVESDLIGLDGGLNLYAYNKGNPIGYFDFLGLAGGGIVTWTIDPNASLPIYPPVTQSGDPISINLTPPPPNPPGTVMMPGYNIWYTPDPALTPRYNFTKGGPIALANAINDNVCKPTLRSIAGLVRSPYYKPPEKPITGWGR